MPEMKIPKMTAQDNPIWQVPGACNKSENAMTFDPTTISSTILIIASLTAAFLAALWLSLVFWTYRDIRKRTQDKLVIIFAVIVVAVLSLPGILIYLILRPQLSAEEEYQRTLEEEALLQSIEDCTYCSSCGSRTQHDWIICPQCHHKLKKTCMKCSRLLELAWDICPYCETPDENMQQSSFTMEEALNSFPSDLQE